MMRMLVFIFFGVIGFLIGFMDTCLCIGNRKHRCTRGTNEIK